MSSDSSPLTAIIEGHAANLLAEGKLDEAQTVGRQALEAAREAVAGDASQLPLLVQALENLAEIQRVAGDYTESEQLYNEALELTASAEFDPSVPAQIRASLATVIDLSGREEDSLPVYEQAIKDLEALTPPDLATIGNLRNNVALNYKHLGKFALAEQHYLRSLEALEAVEGGESEFVASIYNNLGGLYYAAGFASQGKEMFDEALQLRLKLLGENHRDVAQSYSNLGTVHHELGDDLVAQLSFEQALRILEANMPQEAESYQAIGNDYIALLNSIHEEKKAETFQKRMENVLASIQE